jgi:hypothetical protein
MKKKSKILSVIRGDTLPLQMYQFVIASLCFRLQMFEFNIVKNV